MKILRLITSARGKDSQSFQLGNFITDKLKSQDATTGILIRNLAEDKTPHLSEVHINSFNAPVKDLSDDQKKAVEYADSLSDELIQSDVVVMDVPMYNFGIPSSLKAWIDQVTRAGVTFSYTENGVAGLLKNKKVYLAIASGGIYSEGPMKEYDHTEKYLRHVLGFLGISDITTFRVEGVAIPATREMAMPKAVQAVENALATR